MLIDNKFDYSIFSGNHNSAIRSVVDFIRKYTGIGLNRKGALDIVTGYFTIAGLDLLNRELAPENKYRLVLSELTGDDDFMSRVINLLQGDVGIESSLRLSVAAKNAIEFLKRETVQVKAITNAFCHAKAYIYKDATDDAHDYYVMGSSNLTEAGLGMHPSSNIELNFAATGDSNEYNQLRQWFKKQWEEVAQSKIACDPLDSKSEKIDVKEYFIARIEECFGRTHTPEEIYYKILFELFSGDIEIDGNIDDVKNMALLQDSTIYRTLFDYQKKGVISLIKMLRKWNGAILADAVGLGKTFSALAVMKYFQNNGYQVLLLCPKKLQQNWEQYLRHSGSRFERDEFDYHVRFHTDLQGNRMENYKSEKMTWWKKQQKLLVVIDESHNLRNDKSTRYQMLLRELLASDASDKVRDVKVLLLSATPINNSLTDIRNQFKLIAKGEDDYFNKDEYKEDFQVTSLERLFHDANVHFTEWCAKSNRTIGDFIEKLPLHFFDLTDKLIVARTRKMIEKTLGEDLGFPKKDAPDNQYVCVSSIGNYATIADVYEAMLKAKLTAYQPTQYMTAEPLEDGEKKWNDDTFREKFLVKMMSVLFMKRLESCWLSCLKTIEKVADVHKKTLDKVNSFLEEYGTADIDVDFPDADAMESEDGEEEEFTLRNNTINLADMERIEDFRHDLEADVATLNEFCENLVDFQKKFEAGEVADVKLDKLIDILATKQTKPNKKAIIFTTFGDTAKYLYKQITKRHPQWRVACITGQEQFVSEECECKKEPSRFQLVLQRFAPRAKLYSEKDWNYFYNDACVSGMLDRDTVYDADKKKWNVSFEKWQQLISALDSDYQNILDTEIDILIATDCLSEGQNLQDSDLVINYDIHWNPVRLIQRFGRIDRLGSPNKAVRAVNFWPAGTYDEVLQLASRINNKMALMEVAGTETIDVSERLKQILRDNPLVDHNTQKLLKQIKDGNIDDIEQNGVDGSGGSNLGLQDFSLEVFRQDLLDYFEKNRELFRKMPSGIFSGFKVEQTLFDHTEALRHGEGEIGVPFDGEVLVAVLGYPKRNQGDYKTPYSRIYLMLQPAGDVPADWREHSTGGILNFLRINKKAETSLPNWVRKCDAQMIGKMSQILKNWMAVKAPAEAEVNALDLFDVEIPTEDVHTASEDIFKPENFDLIAWEYVSR